MNLSRFKDMGLKWKLLVPLLFLALMGATSLFVVSIEFQRNLLDVNEAKRLGDQYRFFLNDIEFRKNMAMSLAYMAAQDCEVAEAFALRDREKLIELLKPVYEKLHNDFDVQQFHFHTEHATSFLRLHALDNIDCCGEHMESFRHTITKAYTTCTVCGGVEVGTFGFGIRGVSPVLYKGKLVGTVEIGLSIGESFLKNFKNHYDAEVILYAEDKPRSKKLGILAATVPKGVLPPNLLTATFLTGEKVLHTGSHEGSNAAVIAGPIYDFSSEIKAVVEIIVDRGPTLALLKRYAFIAAAIALAGLLLSVSFIWLISEIFTRRIGAIVKGAEEIAAGSRKMQIDIPSADELGCMAVSLNQMLTSLEVSRNKLQEYARDLEVMVEERTRSLKESETTYRTLIENVPITLYMIMTDGTTVFLNRYVEEMLGGTPRELSGNPQKWESFIHPRDRERVITGREECLRDGKELHLDYRMIHKNGYVVYGFDHAVPVFDESNAFVRMDGIILDVTAEKQLHEEHLQAEEMETLSQISSRLAHELRNPLTSIGGLTRRISKTFDPTDPRLQKANLIMEQVEKLERILLMMLSYLSPPSLMPSPALLNTVVRDAVEALEARLKDKNLTVNLSLDSTVGELALDQKMLKNCLVFLMENAYHRMSRRGEIKVKTGRAGKYATISLAYQVQYIADDDVKDFFYPFSVSCPIITDESDTVIMDVPICKRIIHKHGGMINLSRENNHLLWIDIAIPFPQ